jgi:hypothetical protein
MSRIDGGLRSLFREHLPRFHITAIETGSTGRGIPDLEYCFEGKTGWVELKATSGYAVDLRPEQVAWLLRRARAGGRGFLAVRCQAPAGPRRGPAADQLWLIKAERAAELKAGGLYEVGSAHATLWHGGPARWDWAEVARLLTA